MQHIRRFIYFVYETIETSIFILSLFIVGYLFVGFPTGVQGASMEPTLHTNDRIFVNRIAYKTNSVKRGDIVVVLSPKNPDIWYVKRVIAIPKDTILIENGHVYINSLLLEEPYLIEQTNVWENGMIKESVLYTIPEDSLFIMGDNRPRSSDSREFGPIPLSSVVGKAEYRYFPPDKAGFFSQ